MVVAMVRLSVDQLVVARAAKKVVLLAAQHSKILDLLLTVQFGEQNKPN